MVCCHSSGKCHTWMWVDCASMWRKAQSATRRFGCSIRMIWHRPSLASTPSLLYRLGSLNAAPAAAASAKMRQRCVPPVTIPIDNLYFIILQNHYKLVTMPSTSPAGDEQTRSINRSMHSDQHAIRALSSLLVGSCACMTDGDDVQRQSRRRSPAC